MSENMERKKVLLKVPFFIALCFGIFYIGRLLIKGSVPDVSNVQLIRNEIVPFVISRWWDVLVALVIAFIGTWLFTNETIKEYLDYESYLTGGVVLGVIVALAVAIGTILGSLTGKTLTLFEITAVISGILLLISLVIRLLDAGPDVILVFNAGFALGLCPALGLFTSLGMTFSLGIAVTVFVALFAAGLIIEILVKFLKFLFSRQIIVSFGDWLVNRTA